MNFISTSPQPPISPISPISASRDIDPSHSHGCISFVESGIQRRFDLNLHGDIGAFLAAWDLLKLGLAWDILG